MKGGLKGKKEVPLIFEESDGMNLKQQGRDRRRHLGTGSWR